MHDTGSPDWQQTETGRLNSVSSFFFFSITGGVRGLVKFFNFFFLGRICKIKAKQARQDLMGHLNHIDHYLISSFALFLLISILELSPLQLVSAVRTRLHNYLKWRQKKRGYLFFSLSFFSLQILFRIHWKRRERVVLNIASASTTSKDGVLYSGRSAPLLAHLGGWRILAILTFGRELQCSA